MIGCNFFWVWEGRSLAIASAFAILSELSSLGELADAARNKGTEVNAPKPPKEEKDVGGYDAKVRATYRRKEAMKEAMAKQRERSALKKEAALVDSIKAKAPVEAKEAKVASTPPQESSATTPVVDSQVIQPPEVAKEPEPSLPVAE